MIRRKPGSKNICSIILICFELNRRRSVGLGIRSENHWVNYYCGCKCDHDQNRNGVNFTQKYVNLPPKKFCRRHRPADLTICTDPLLQVLLLTHLNQIILRQEHSSGNSKTRIWSRQTRAGREWKSGNSRTTLKTIFRNEGTKYAQSDV